VKPVESTKRTAIRRSYVAAMALVLAALDLALARWPIELWRETTVFNGQFAVLGVIGGPLELATIAATAWFAWTLRGQGGFRIAAAACAAFLAALVAWLMLVAPANAILATWTPGPVPPGAEEVRLTWETGHITAAAIKLAGFVMLALAATHSSAAP
jgi:hypothetical protein